MAICSTNGGKRIQTQVCFLFAFEELRGLEIQQQLCRIDFISDFWTVYCYTSLRLSGETVLAGTMTTRSFSSMGRAKGSAIC
mmetsp:Transcript_24489/g.44183  ORF Transcript_24489/g.44183 Transcript_24489/m.44183 type:complete len:82 (+) Transcript_24489:419-664(+)